MNIYSWNTKKIGDTFKYTVTCFDSSEPVETRKTTIVTEGTRRTRAQASGIAKRHAGALRHQAKGNK